MWAVRLVGLACLDGGFICLGADGVIVGGVLEVAEEVVS